MLCACATIAALVPHVCGGRRPAGQRPLSASTRPSAALRSANSAAFPPAALSFDHRMRFAPHLESIPCTPLTAAPSAPLPHRSGICWRRMIWPTSPAPCTTASPISSKQGQGWDRGPAPACQRAGAGRLLHQEVGRAPLSARTLLPRQQRHGHAGWRVHLLTPSAGWGGGHTTRGAILQTPVCRIPTQLQGSGGGGGAAGRAARVPDSRRDQSQP